jgi:signal transduction histidine kinase
MIEPAIPPDEDARLAALRNLHLLDTSSEERFDRITRIARDLFKVQIALISLVDAERQWFKSRIGLTASETPRAISFCGHAILDKAPFVVENALLDERFRDNPLVTGEPHIRFYAGMPLTTLDGQRIGTLCLIDGQARDFPATDRARLRDLGAIAEQQVNFASQIDASLDEMRRIFARLVSHELRTPLTGISTSLQILKSQEHRDSMTDTLLDEALASTNRLGRSVGDIIGFAEIEESLRHLVPQAIDLESFLSPILASLLPLAADKRIRLTAADMTGRCVHADPQALQQILHALLENAVQFSPPDSEVHVDAEEKPVGMLRLAVTDHGSEIKPDELFRVFIPYAQLDASDSRQHDGLGIRLAICHRLAVAMHGRIGYLPNPAGGSRFFVDLPGNSNARDGKAPAA